MRDKTIFKTRLLGHALALCVAFAAIPAYADVKLPAIFSDHMVLQRDMKIPIWGLADPGEAVTVSFAGETASATAGLDGKWRVNLGSLPANADPQTMRIAGKNKISFSDVLVGDVWLCSGQSNMGVMLGESYNAAADVPKAADPSMRLFYVQVDSTSITPKEDVPLWNGKRWRACSPETAQAFSAVGYYFGHEIRRHENVPIGLIDSAQGGSSIQLWISLEGFKKAAGNNSDFNDWLAQRQAVVDAYQQRLAAYGPAKAKYDQDIRRWYDTVYNAPDFKARREEWFAANNEARAEGKPPIPQPEPSEPRPTAPEEPDCGPHNNFMIANIYNTMIAPLIPFAIKGVVWYQGESNDYDGKQYNTLFPMMIEDWRQNWGEGDFPFLFVQLPNMGKPQAQPVQEADRWPLVREAQANALKLSKTGMAVIFDVGDPYQIHGKDKYDPGYRLALVARRDVYGEKIVADGPTYNSMKIEGNSIRVEFKNAGSGLVVGGSPWTPSGAPAPIGSELRGFAIAAADKEWYWAQARIDGDSVVVSSDRVSDPVAVRYGWANNPIGNLYNMEKLPAAQFRTDSW